MSEEKFQLPDQLIIDQSKFHCTFENSIGGGSSSDVFIGR